MEEGELKIGEDFYFNEDGLMVLTAAYLLKRGTCCEKGCLHCPYGFRKGDLPPSTPPKGNPSKIK